MPSTQNQGQGNKLMPCGPHWTQGGEKEVSVPYMVSYRCLMLWSLDGDALHSETVARQSRVAFLLSDE
jgi:hypothetical protein